MKMNRKGFTLVELMIVLAILGVLAGIGIPQYMSVLERSKVGADRATIAAVQSALNAFIAEAGGVGEVEVDDADIPAAGVEVATPSEITGVSIITGQEITFEDFWDGADVWPTLQSDFESGTWTINDDGMIYVVDDEGSELPDYTV